MSGEAGLLLPVAVGILALAVFGFSWLALASLVRPREQEQRRRIARTIAGHTLALRVAEVRSVRRAMETSSIKGLDRLLRRIVPNVEGLRLRLERTGLKASVGVYALATALLVVLAYQLAKIAFGASAVQTAFVALAAGLPIPYLFVKIATARRLKRFLRSFPDAVDLMVRGIKSGLPVSETITAVGQDMAGPVGEEFGRISAQMRIGVPLDEALRSTAERVDLPEYKFFVVSLALQRETGGNLSEILANLSDLIRKREHLRLKVKAMSAEARASAAIIGALPFVMGLLLFAINREYIMLLFTDPRGLVLLSGGLLAFAVGVLTIVRMVRFDF